MKFSVGDKVKFKSDVTGEFIDATVIDIIDGRYVVNTVYGRPRILFTDRTLYSV